MIALLLALQVGTLPSPVSEAQVDTVPVITLTEALRRASRLDPNYVASLGNVGDAAWGRRAARLAFVLPSVQVQSSATRFSTEFFNIGTGQLASQIVDFRLEGSYRVFGGGSKIAQLREASAELNRAEADLVETQFETAFATESDFYDVLLQRDLSGVAQERVRRADEQLGVARARVLSGAAVQTDSLQLLLELNRAQVDLLRQTAALKVARLQLGRRVGADGPVDAAPLDSLATSPLPLTEQDAVTEATARSPRVVGARADERAAGAAVAAARGTYWPQVDLFGQLTTFDDQFFPDATTRSAAGFRVTIPIWNNAQREVALSRALTNREVAQATRDDTERGIRRDVIEAYENYNTARASTELAARSVLVAQENLRVQSERYRAGATTIIDLIIAQVSLAEAEAELAQARYGALLALAGLEAIIGRRLFSERNP